MSRFRESAILSNEFHTVPFTYISAVLVVALTLSSQTVPREQVGPSPDGSFLLNSGWRLRPAGTQIPLDTLPMACALSKDGKYLVVLNGGYNPPSLSVLDTAGQRELSRTTIPDGWLGLTFSPDGRTLWVGGGARAAIFEFSFDAEGALKPGRTFPLVEHPGEQDFIGDVAQSPDGRLLYAADMFHDSVLVVNPQSGRVIDRFKTGRRPYRILFHPNGQSFFVTSWADGTLQQLQASNGSVLNTVRLGAHPTDIVWSDRKTETMEGDETDGATQWNARLFVAAANTNNVYVLGVSESAVTSIETINVAMTPRHPLGMTPSALALSPDQKRLYVVCSDANAVAVADVGEKHAHVLGFVPVGWYPTAARVLVNGTLAVINAKGIRSYPNPQGPVPTMNRHQLVAAGRTQYVAHMQTGTASFIAPFDEAALNAYTKQVLANSPYNDNMLDTLPAPEGNPIPSVPGDPSPIKHVIYIVKENRSWDQVLGDMGKGNCDPSLVLFGENITPNQHKLARDFVLLDNFYVSADVSADGHNWSTSAIAGDYVQKMWPTNYAGRRKVYDFEGGEPAALPPAGYLWTNAIAHGLTLRNYGYWVENLEKPTPDGTQVKTVHDPQLVPVTNMKFRSFDLDYPDVERTKVFLSDLAEFEKTGDMPQLILMRLPNDHTYGVRPGKLAPFALAADNDYAVGMLVEAVSKSRFWASTAIFILEDDAQNGPDHVDSHRSPGYVVSPYTRHGTIDSTLYNTTSMLRTMELILGLNPMTHYDAGATPMFASFAKDPVLTPWEAEKPRTPLDQRNPAATAGVPSSVDAAMDFRDADLNDDDALNAVLWRAIRKTEPPAPVASFFSH
jgi:YVTN family beta-propeller protein